ncbi:MAG: glycosyltransferase [Pseudomonadota bacterium]
MAYLASALAIVIWTYLLIGRDAYWRASEELPPAYPPKVWPDVSAIIPARDEVETIGAVVKAHAATTYPGKFTISIVNDASSDATADEVLRAAQQSGRQIELLNAPPLPDGWKGKMNAVATGIQYVHNKQPTTTSQENTNKYFLLTDADIVMGPETLMRLVAHAVSNDIALTSLMARLDSRGLWGGLLIPAFVYFFQQLYPFPASNNPKSRTAAAAGGCMLVNANALAKAGGIEAIKGALIDDCALAHLIKNGNPRRVIWLGLAKNDEAISLRDNRSLSSIWTMVSRSAFAQLNHSWALLALSILGMFLIYLAPPALVVFGVLNDQTVLAAIAGGATLLMALSYFPTIRSFDQHPIFSFALPIAAFFYLLMTISSGLNHARGKGGAWKGRTYQH